MLRRQRLIKQQSTIIGSRGYDERGVGVWILFVSVVFGARPTLPTCPDSNNHWIYFLRSILFDEALLWTPVLRLFFFRPHIRRSSIDPSIQPSIHPSNERASEPASESAGADPSLAVLSRLLVTYLCYSCFCRCGSAVTESISAEVAFGCCWNPVIATCVAATTTSVATASADLRTQAA